MEKKKIIAVQLCESIDLKSFIQNFSGKLPTIDSREFFFQNESQQVVYIFNYGVVCFFGYPETDRTGLVNQVRKFCTHLLEENIHEEYEIHIRPGSFEIEFDHITIGEPDPVSIKLIC